MPGAIQDAARRGGIPDRDLALMESWYMNSLHPLDDPELQAQWHKRFKRIKEERFMEKMLAGPWREASRPHRWFPKSQWDDPYVDHEYVSALGGFDSSYGLFARKWFAPGFYCLFGTSMVGVFHPHTLVLHMPRLMLLLAWAISWPACLFYEGLCSVYLLHF
jgi:hypothetical protein